MSKCDDVFRSFRHGTDIETDRYTDKMVEQYRAMHALQLQAYALSNT